MTSGRPLPAASKRHHAIAPASAARASTGRDRTPLLPSNSRARDWRRQAGAGPSTIGPDDPRASAAARLAHKCRSIRKGDTFGGDSSSHTDSYGLTCLFYEAYLMSKSAVKILRQSLWPPRPHHRHGPRSWSWCKRSRLESAALGWCSCSSTSPCTL